MTKKRSISFAHDKEYILDKIGALAKELGWSWSATVVHLIEAGLGKENEILIRLDQIEQRLDALHREN